MDFKELKNRFHEIDSKISSHFHKNDSNGAKKLSWGKVILVWLLTVFLAGFLVTSLSSLHSSFSFEPNHFTLSEESSVINANQSTYLIKGNANPNATILISSLELGLNKLPVKVDSNGNFSYVVSFPKEILDTAELGSVNIIVFYEMVNKSQNKKIALMIIPSDKEVEKKVEYEANATQKALDIAWQEYQEGNITYREYEERTNAIKNLR